MAESTAAVVATSVEIATLETSPPVDRAAEDVDATIEAEPATNGVSNCEETAVETPESPEAIVDLEAPANGSDECIDETQNVAVIVSPSSATDPEKPVLVSASEISPEHVAAEQLNVPPVEQEHAEAAKLVETVHVSDENGDGNEPAEVEHVSAADDDGIVDDTTDEQMDDGNAVDPMKPDFEYSSLENQDDADDARSDVDDVDMLHASPHHIMMSESPTAEHDADDDEEGQEDDDHEHDEYDEDENIGDDADDYGDENIGVDGDEEDDEGEQQDVVNETDDDQYDTDMIIPDMLVHPPKAGKKRRRILALNSANEDSSGDEQTAHDLYDERLGSSSDDAAAAEDRLADERLKALVKNEKPGPKSMKQSTQLLKELEARALLQSAVVIPVSVDAAKKRKMRILESDDDDDDGHNDDGLDGAVLGLTGVDDIGIDDDRIDADDQADEAALCAELIIADAMPYDDEQDVKNVVQRLEEFERTLDDDDDDDEIIPEQKCMVKMELSESETAKPSKKDGRNGRSTNKHNNGKPAVRVKDEHKSAKASSSQKERYSLCSSSDDEYVPNDVYFGTPDRNNMVRKTCVRGRGRGGRGSSSSQRYEEERKHRERQEKAARGRGRGRGRPPGQKSKSNKYVSESGSSEPSSCSESDSAAHRRKPGKKPTPVVYNQQKVGGPSINAKRKARAARFKDKARKIPNDVYFDSKVPLHVLYAYGTDTSEDDMPPFPPLSTITGRLAVPKPAPYKPRGGRGASSSTRGKSTSSAPPSQPSQQAKASSSARLVHSAAAPSTSKRGRKPSNPGKTNADFRLKHMKKCFRAAGFQKLRFKELWQDCDTSMERADKIMQLLRDNGLEGEPTIDNCRLLRKEVVINEEVYELDPSLIIKTEGRTRRSAALAATQPPANAASTETSCAAADEASTSTPATEQRPEDSKTAAVLTKIKKLVDSDSDDAVAAPAIAIDVPENLQGDV